MRCANKAIKKENIVSTAEEILQEILEAKVFTKLHLNMAFHHIELQQNARDIRDSIKLNCTKMRGTFVSLQDIALQDEMALRSSRMSFGKS